MRQADTSPTSTPDAGVADAATDAARDAGVAAPTDAGVELPAGVPPPLPTGPNACSTNEEEDRKNAFRLRSFSLPDFTPATGLGRFDARYWPLTTLMFAITRLHFKFVAADNTPDPFTLLWMMATGQSVDPFFWSDAEETQFESDFVQRTTSRWSFQHQFRSTKPCWPFIANPLLTPQLVDDPTDAHFKMTVHKSPGPAIDYKSGIVHPRDPAVMANQGWGDLWGSDVREEPDFNSTDVARSERTRIDRAIRTASASPITFDVNSTVVRPADVTRLNALAVALNKKDPSAPAIPINLKGFASREGGRTHNQGLSNDRAEAVRNLLQAAGVAQPLVIDPRGPVGAPGDAANRRVDLETDTSFENTYNTNRYSVAEHEFGHFFGLPDEYQNNTGSVFLGTAQTQMDSLTSRAGVDSPDGWGDTTASQMSAGVDILPRHYVTLWEALGTMTSPDIAQSEWSID
jgi:outer membrane protein OmpA-like peptidoglycan-associated protein